MKINHVHMENFGNVVNQDLDFSEGLILFSGNNGEGKSTILRCITLLLFNQTTGKLSDYIRWGSEGFSISVDVNHLNKHLLISFEYSKKSSTREVTDLDTGETYQNTAALSFLDDLFDTKRAISSIVSFENEIDLISTSPSERREYLKRIYDLNFKQQLSQINVDKDTLAAKEIKLNSDLSNKKSQTFERLVLSRLPFTEETYSEKLKNLSSQEELRQNLIHTQTLKKEKEETKDSLEFELFKADKTIKNSLSEKKSLEEQIEDKTKKCDSLKLDTSDLEETKETKKIELINKLDSLKKITSDYEVKLSALEEPKFNNNIDYDSLKHTKFDCQYKIKDLNEQKKTFQTGICPTCHRPVKDTFTEEIDSKILEITQKYDEVVKSIKKYEEEKEVYEKNYKSFKELKNSLEKSIYENESSIKMLEKDSESLEEDFKLRLEMRESKFNSQKELLNQEILSDKKQLERLEDSFDSLYDNRTRLENDLKVVTKELNSIENVDSLIEDKESLIAKIKSDIQLYESTVSSNEEKKKLNKIQEQKELARDAEVEKLSKDLLETQKDITKNAFASRILSKEFPSFVISRMISSLTYYTNEFLSKVYPEYTLDIVESKSSLRVLYGPNKSDVKLASGFEQQIFSFSWKYALGKIQNYNMLILDEVDSAASEENSNKFYSTLAKMEDCFKQVFIVTHKQDIKDMLATDFSADVYEVKKGVYSKVN